MKKNTFKTLFGSLVVGSALMAVPLSTFAATDASTASVTINGDGIAHIINAEVTSISGNIINAVARFRNTLINLSLTTTASTTVNTRGTTSTTTSAIQAGDRLNVTGALTTIGSTLGINVTNLKDLTSTSTSHKEDANKETAGAVTSIAIASGTFVLTTNNGKILTVQTNSSTSFALGNTASTTLASMMLGEKVTVTGTMNATGTILTATKVTAHIGELKKEIKEDWLTQFKNMWKNNFTKNNEGDNNH